MSNEMREAFDKWWAIDTGEMPTFEDSFKAGAKWMQEQQIKKNEELIKECEDKP